MSKTDDTAGEDFWLGPPKPKKSTTKTCKVCNNPFVSPNNTVFCGADCAKEGQPRGRKRQVNTQTYTVPGKTARPRTIEKVCEAPGCGRPFMAVREAARFCGNGCRGRNNRHQAIDRAVVACADGWRKAVEALEGQIALYKVIVSKGGKP